MSRKDYELIAGVLRKLGNDLSLDSWSDSGIHERVSAEFADALKSTNANFDRHRFLKACGVTEKETAS